MKNFTDENGLRQGYWEFYRIDKVTMKFTCNYINGQLNGEFKVFYPHGEIKMICNYVNGHIEGEYKTFDCFGIIDRVSNYFNDYEVCLMGNILKIGCQAFDIEYWKENYRIIAAENDIENEDTDRIYKYVTKNFGTIG